jgi:hypothetical protein
MLRSRVSSHLCSLRLCRQFDESCALRRGGLVCVLDNMVCMNSVIKLMIVEFKHNLNKAGDVW